MKKNRRIGSLLDDFLKREGILEKVEALAITEAKATRVGQAIKRRRRFTRQQQDVR